MKDNRSRTSTLILSLVLFLIIAFFAYRYFGNYPIINVILIIASVTYLFYLFFQLKELQLHKEAYPTVFYASVLFVFFNVGTWLLLREHLIFHQILLGITSALLLIIFYFFRVRRSRPDIKENTVLSPAYGTVVNIENVMEDEFYQKEMKCVSIFMSPLDIHCNYVPVSGKVNYFQYHPGKYLVAFHPKSSALNEHTSVGIENSNIQLLVKQIAGFMARRIVPYLKEAQDVTQNDELGFIRFGSRVDVFFPLNTSIKVKVGDKLKGGKSSLATY